MKTRIAPAALGEPRSGKTSQRLLQLLMQSSLAGSEGQARARGPLSPLAQFGPGIRAL